jgi:hypothetical protein
MVPKDREPFRWDTMHIILKQIFQRLPPAYEVSSSMLLYSRPCYLRH